MWRYGQSLKLPIAEGSGSAAPAFGEYGIQKDRIARMLKEETASGGLATTSLHPGHIVGPGWHPIGPLGNLDPAAGTPFRPASPCRPPEAVPELMHHVHADDVAQAFEKAIEHRDAAAGEDFNVVAPTALNVRGYADIAAAWFGQAAALETVTWEQFRKSTTPEYAESSWGHLYSQPLLYHREGQVQPGLRPAVRARTGCVRIRPVAHRTRPAPGRPPAYRLGLTASLLGAVDGAA